MCRDHSQMGLQSNGISSDPVSLPEAFCEIASIDRKEMNREVLTEPRSETNPNSSALRNPTLDDNNQSKEMVIINGFTNTCPISAMDNKCFRRIDMSELDKVGKNEITQESGYMADTELNSPKMHKSRLEYGKQRKRKNVCNNVDLDDECDSENIDDNSSPKHEPYPLKISDGTVSLYRIRQGKTLHKALRITYFTTLLGFICCILQLYAMFGVYGVLGSDQKVEPWPWFLYHLIMR